MEMQSDWIPGAETRQYEVDIPALVPMENDRYI